MEQYIRGAMWLDGVNTPARINDNGTRFSVWRLQKHHIARRWNYCQYSRIACRLLHNSGKSHCDWSKVLWNISLNSTLRADLNPLIKTLLFWNSLAMTIYKCAVSRWKKLNAYKGVEIAKSFQTSVATIIFESENFRRGRKQKQQQNFKPQ